MLGLHSGLTLVSRATGGALPVLTPTLPRVRGGSGRRPEISLSLSQIFGAPSMDLEVQRAQNMIALERKFSESHWVYLCTRRKARDLASAPMIVTRPGDEPDERIRVDDPEHPLVRLLHKPNPWMTMLEMLQATSIYLDLTGNAFWLSFSDQRGAIVELYPINPFAVRIFTGPNAIVDHYEVFHWGQVFRFPFHQLLHFRLENPLGVGMSSALPSVWGQGPLEAAWQIVTTDQDAVRWNRNLVKNDGRPTGMLTSELDVSAVDAQAAAERYRQTFAGPDGAGKVLVLGKNLKYVRLADTPKDLDYKETRAMLREEIIALFGLNSAVVGIQQGDVGRRKEMHADYWEGTVVTTSRSDLMPPINEFLAPRFGDDLQVSQDFSAIRALQENEDERVGYISKYWAMGVPFAELNKRFTLGFEEFPGADVGFISSMVVPIDQVISGVPPIDFEKEPREALPLPNQEGAGEELEGPSDTFLRPDVDGVPSGPKGWLLRSVRADARTRKLLAPALPMRRDRSGVYRLDPCWGLVPVVRGEARRPVVAATYRRAQSTWTLSRLVAGIGELADEVVRERRRRALL